MEAAGRGLRLLNMVRSVHVQPVVERLQRYCKQIGTQFFHTHSPSAAISHLDTTIEFADLFADQQWESALSQFTTGNTSFQLSGSEPVRVSYLHRFHGYAGRSADGFDSVGGFDVGLLIEWRIGSDSVTRTVSLDGTQDTSFEAELPHSRSNTAQADTDRFVAAIVTALLDRIRGSDSQGVSPALEGWPCRDSSEA